MRLLRTNLAEDDIRGEVREELVQAMFDQIHVGVGQEGIIPMEEHDIDDILTNGIDWAVENGFAWQEDKEHCEENECMDTADARINLMKLQYHG